MHCSLRTHDANMLCREKDDEHLSKQLRVEFFKNFQGIKQSVTALLQDWLVGGSPTGIPSLRMSSLPRLGEAATDACTDQAEFRLLREAYLPEVILAYDGILNNAGLYITRNNFLEAMELSATIAGEGSDLAELFVKTGKMKQLVEAFAADSTSLLFSTSAAKGFTKPSRRAKERGWSRDLWKVEG